MNPPNICWSSRNDFIIFRALRDRVRWCQVVSYGFFVFVEQLCSATSHPHRSWFLHRFVRAGCRSSSNSDFAKIQWYVIRSAVYSLTISYDFNRDKYKPQEIRLENHANVYTSQALKSKMFEEYTATRKCSVQVNFVQWLMAFWQCDSEFAHVK